MNERTVYVTALIEIEIPADQVAVYLDAYFDGSCPGSEAEKLEALRESFASILADMNEYAAEGTKETWRVLWSRSGRKAILEREAARLRRRGHYDEDTHSS